MSHCNDCIKGVRHEGIPEGEVEVIGGVKCYVGTPSGECPKEKAILFLTDVFGIELINSQLLVDDFARNGFKTIAIDYLNGDPISDDVLPRPNTNFDFIPWLSKHGNDETRPNVDKVIAALREQGVTEFGVTGYCFGARYAFDLAFQNLVKVTVVSHPAFLEIPKDFMKYKELSNAPLLINSCTIDKRFPHDAQVKADEILGGGNQFTDTYRREYFEGCSHGFAVRGDLSDPKVKAGKEGSFEASVKFFNRFL